MADVQAGEGGGSPPPPDVTAPAEVELEAVPPPAAAPEPVLQQEQHQYDEATAAAAIHAPATEAFAQPSTESVQDARARAQALAAMFSAQAASRVAAAEGHGSDDAASGGAKRKFDGDGYDGPDAKRSAFPDYLGAPHSSVPSLPAVAGTVSLSEAAAAAAAGLHMELIMCPNDKVGRIIGRAGATIRDLETNTGTRIQVDHKAPGECKPVTVSGKREDVDRCKRQIMDLIENDAPPGQAAGDASRHIECPAGIVGRIIGRGGETIRSLQNASGAHILINQDFPADHPRQIVISGKQDSVDRAFHMVTELINGDPGSAQSVIQKHGVGAKEVMECAKTMVGRIIGKGGETIKDLQKRFSTSIQIDQASTPCHVTITGPGPAVAATRRAIEDLLGPGSGGGPPPPSYGMRPPGPAYPTYPPPYAGGGGGYGGYGGYPPHPHQQQYPPSGPGGYPGGGGYGGYPPSGGGGGGYPGYAQPYGGGGSGGMDSGQYQAYGGGGGGSAAAHSQPPPPAAASVWQAMQDDQGRTYYYNSQTGVSQWEKPVDM